METLDSFGTRHKTDKASYTHGYLDVYEEHLKSWREREFVMLEIGVAGGASLAMWREYFPKAKIYGIDNNPDCEQYGGVFIGNQNDTDFLQRVLDEIGAPDVIIDDGSHVGQDMIDTFKFLFIRMNPGGIYIIEDFHTTFSTHYSGEFEANGRTHAFNFFADLACDIDVAGRGMCGNPEFCIDHPSTEPPVPEYSRILKSMHVYCSLRILNRR